MGKLNYKKYKITPLSKCIDEGGYINFKREKKQSYWAFYPHDYLLSFWHRRDIEGSLGLAWDGEN